jgi:hypothetical protein
MDHHMINIDYNGLPVNIKALLREDGNDMVYDLYSNDMHLGTIYPDVNEHSVCVEWKTNDLIAPELVFMRGAEIERQDR